MEYIQMTLTDWAEMKRKLRQELLGVKQSFVRIGYALRKIEDHKLYEQDGYKSIAEFAKEEYGLEPSTTSRFMSINREYSIDGYSEQLRPEYADLGRSQLEEMLKLPEEDRPMVQQETSREDIRELKRFNKEEPAAGVADDLRQLIEKFYHDNPDVLNAVFAEPAFEETNIKRLADLVNPGGNRSYKKGLFFLMMYENRIVVKKFGSTPHDLTWWEFWKITLDIFGEAAAGSKTWEKYFGISKEPDTKDSEREEETNTDPEEHEERNEDTEAPEKKIAPAQKVPEILEKEASEEAPQKDDKEENPTEKEPEEEPQEELKDEPEEKEPLPPMNPPVFGNRKEFIDALTIREAAEYLRNEFRRHALTFSVMDSTWELEEWLKQEVDEDGKEVINLAD